MHQISDASYRLPSAEAFRNHPDHHPAVRCQPVPWLRAFEWSSEALGALTPHSSWLCAEQEGQLVVRGPGACPALWG